MNTDLALIIIGLCGIALGFLNLRLRAKNKVLSSKYESASQDADWQLAVKKEFRTEALKLRTENEELKTRVATERALANEACFQSNEFRMKYQMLRTENKDLTVVNEGLAGDVASLCTQNSELRAKVEKAEQGADYWKKQYTLAEKDIEELAAEADSLEAALEAQLKISTNLLFDPNYKQPEAVIVSGPTGEEEEPE